MKKQMVVFMLCVGLAGCPGADGIVGRWELSAFVTQVVEGESITVPTGSLEVVEFTSTGEYVGVGTDGERTTLGTWEAIFPADVLVSVGDTNEVLPNGTFGLRFTVSGDTLSGRFVCEPGPGASAEDVMACEEASAFFEAITYAGVRIPEGQ